MDDLVRHVDVVLAPSLPIVGAQDNDFALLAAQRGEVGHLHDDRAQEFRPDRAELEHAARQRLALHQRRRMHGALRLHVAARDARGLCGRPGRHDDAHATVAAAPHGTAARIDQEGNQEASETESKPSSLLANRTNIAEYGTEPKIER